MTPLSPREIEVARLVADAWTNKQIATKVNVSERRARALVSSVARKLGADTGRDDRVQVAKLWMAQQAA